MSAPVIQSLDQILAELQPGYAQEEAIIQGQQATIGQQTQAAQAGLGVAKDNAFRDINRGANARGAAFSGVPIEEQMRYVGEKYLPGMQQLEADAANRRSQLDLTLAGLAREKRTTAYSRIDNQKAAASAYEQAMADRAFKAEQAERDRQIERMKIAAASGKEASPPPQWMIKQQDAATLAQVMKSKTGRDGYVSPDTYLRAKQEWVNAGYSSQEFDSFYSNYRDPKNRYYKVG